MRSLEEIYRPFPDEAREAAPAAPPGSAWDRLFYLFMIALLLSAYLGPCVLHLAK